MTDHKKPNPAMDVPDFDERPDPADTLRRYAAILVLVQPLESGPNVLFIRRSQKVRTHKGQISFPGGSFDPEDVTLENTALREANEELGLEPEWLRIIGKLPATETVVSNFTVHPYVAVPRDRDTNLIFKPDNFEVDHIFYVPLPELLKPSSLRLENWRVGGHSRTMVFYSYENYVIWGATAFILHNFINQIKAGGWQELFEL
jgi:8-oxo-dGTP pyrophosphatase MutT (NUDIX family)